MYYCFQGTDDSTVQEDTVPSFENPWHSEADMYTKATLETTQSCAVCMAQVLPPEAHVEMLLTRSSWNMQTWSCRGMDTAITRGLLGEKGTCTWVSVHVSWDCSLFLPPPPPVSGPAQRPCQAPCCIPGLPSCYIMSKMSFFSLRYCVRAGRRPINIIWNSI